MRGTEKWILTITMCSFVAIKTGAMICVVPIYTCAIDTGVWIAIVRF